MGPPKSAPGKKAVKTPEGDVKNRRAEKEPVMESDNSKKAKTTEVPADRSEVEITESRLKITETIPENPYAHILPPRVELPSVQTPDRVVERQRRIQPELPKEILSGKEAEDAIAEEFVKKIFEVPIEVVAKDLVRLSKSVRAKIGRRLRTGKYGDRIPVDKTRLVAQLLAEAE